jgi:hypothetical protein
LSRSNLATLVGSHRQLRKRRFATSWHASTRSI